MTCYKAILHRHPPQLNATHTELLALALDLTLNGLPGDAFCGIADIARRMGPDRLADFHQRMCA